MFAICVVLLLALAGSASGQVAGCNGLGSSAQNQLITQIALKAACAKGLPKYQSVGSGAGQNGLRPANRAWDYALSDAPLLPCAANIVNVAYTVGLMSVYAKPGVSNIQMTGCGLAAIYTARPTAKTYNSAFLTVAEPRLKTITLAVRPIIRSDDSGTTFTFTNMMFKTCRSLWGFSTLFNFKGKVGLAGILASAVQARGTSGVVTAFGATPGAIAYISSTAIEPQSFEAKLQSQRTVGVGPYFFSSQTNFAALTAGVPLGSATCGLTTEITGRKTAAGVYPLAYLGWYLAWSKARRPTQKPCVKALCLCLLSAGSSAVMNSVAFKTTEYRPVPATLSGPMLARCALL